MQSITVSTAGTYPDSTTVKAYLPSQIPEKGRRAPIGAAVAEAATAAGALTLTGLTEGQSYVLAAEVSSKWVYMQVTAPVGAGNGFAKVTAANTITLPEGDVIEVEGTTEIKKIIAGRAGKRITLIFKESVAVKKGENLKIKEEFAATALDTLSLACDGTSWFETGRSVN